MSGWEINDGRGVLGPMSEDAVIWAIKQGLPSDTRVRRKGTDRWMALDDHEPFAGELVYRTSMICRGRRRIWPLGYTWQEFAAMVFALGTVALLVIGVGWVEENWQAIRRELKDRQEDPHLRATSAHLPFIVPAERPSAPLRAPREENKAARPARASNR